MEKEMPVQSSRVDAIDVVFGLIPAGVSLLVAVLWGRLLAGAIRGDAPRVPLGTSVVSGLAVAAWAFMSGTRVRENVALRESMVEVRELVREEVDGAVARDEREIARDARDVARNEQLYKINVGLLILAALTLAAAIVTLADGLA